MIAGIIMKEQRRPFTEEEERTVTVTHTFDKFHYWNLDKKPSADDRFSQMLDWVELSKTVSVMIYGRLVKMMSGYLQKMRQSKIICIYRVLNFICIYMYMYVQHLTRIKSPVGFKFQSVLSCFLQHYYKLYTCLHYMLYTFKSFDNI